MEFRVTYANNKQVLGQVNSKGCSWGNLKHEDEIEYLEFRAGNVVYTLGGFEEYNIKIEKISLSGIQGISKVFVFGRGLKESFVLSAERSEDGIKINELECEVGQEYGGIKVNDWRKGKFNTPYAVKCDLRTKKIKGIYDINNKCVD